MATGTQGLPTERRCTHRHWCWSRPFYAAPCSTADAVRQDELTGRQVVQSPAPYGNPEKLEVATNADFQRSRPGKPRWKTVQDDENSLTSIAIILNFFTWLIAVVGDALSAAKKPQESRISQPTRTCQHDDLGKYPP